MNRRKVLLPMLNNRFLSALDFSECFLLILFNIVVGSTGTELRNDTQRLIHIKPNHETEIGNLSLNVSSKVDSTSNSTTTLAVTYLDHGSWCEPNNSKKICNSNSKLHCKYGKCQCMSQHVYKKSESTCVPVRQIGESCTFQRECMRGPGGFYSHCVHGTCKCRIKNGPHKIVEIGNECILAKKLLEKCERHEQCRATLGPHAICSEPLPPLKKESKRELCQCGKTSYFRFGECLAYASKDTNWECKEDIQCTNGTTGTLSRCSQSRGKCECWDAETNSTGMFYPSTGECFKKRQLGSPCESTKECRASSSKLVCTRTFENSTTKTCQCDRLCKEYITKPVKTTNSFAKNQMLSNSSSNNSTDSNEIVSTCTLKFPERNQVLFSLLTTLGGLLVIFIIFCSAGLCCVVKFRHSKICRKVLRY